MNAISPEEIPDNVIHLIGKQWMLVGAGTPTEFNFMTANWGNVGFLWNKPVATAFIRPERYTDKFMQKNDCYTLSFFTEKYIQALSFCGKFSGKNVDKVAGSGLTPQFTPEGHLSFKEAKLTLVCKKLYVDTLHKEGFIDTSSLKRWYGEEHGELHKMYIGEIIHAYIQDK